MRQKQLLIVGRGSLFESAPSYWREQQPDREIVSWEIKQQDASALEAVLSENYSPQDSAIFVAMGISGMSLARLEVLSKLISLGFHAESFIHRSATVAPTAIVGVNCWIGENSVIGSAAKLDYNIFLGPRSVIGHGSHISHSTWLGSNCILGPRSSVGMHCVLGNGIELEEGVNVGRFSNLQRAQRFVTSVPARTFIHEMFDKPVQIYGQ